MHVREISSKRMDCRITNDSWLGYINESADQLLTILYIFFIFKGDLARAENSDFSNLNSTFYCYR